MKPVLVSLGVALACVGSANLVRNPGFEEWTERANGPATFAHWELAGGEPWAQQYADHPVQGITTGEKTYVTGGTRTYSSLEQSLTLPAGAAGGTFEFSAFVGGMGTHGDVAEVKLSFIKAGTALETIVLNAPGPWGDGSSFLYGMEEVRKKGTIPAGTVSALVSIELTKGTGRANHAAVDNVSVTVIPVPEPVSLATLATGWALTKRRRR